MASSSVSPSGPHPHSTVATKVALLPVARGATRNSNPNFAPSMEHDEYEKRMSTGELIKFDLKHIRLFAAEMDFWVKASFETQEAARGCRKEATGAM